MERLKQIKNVVRGVLIERPDARDDDGILYYFVCCQFNANFPKLTTAEVFVFRKSHNLPTFESVRRTRQKIQAEEPELKGTEDVQHRRLEAQWKYMRFAKEDSDGMVTIWEEAEE